MQARPGDAELTVVLVIRHDYVRQHFGAPPDKDVDRFDRTVAVVVMPGKRPVGVYQVWGEEWPAERRRLKGDGPDGNRTMARWVTNFVAGRN